MKVLALIPIALVLAVPAQAAAPSRLLVEATEFRFTLSRTTIKPGSAIIQLAIRGEDPHDLRIRKVGSPRATTSGVNETLPGAVAEWRGKLTTGKWELSCSIEGHKQAGMRTVLSVK